MVKQIQSDEEFEKTISEDKITLVDFWASWCGPCRVMAPIFEKFAETYSNVNFIKVNTDEQYNLCSKYSVQSLPTFAFFKSGKRIDDLDVIGANQSKLEEHIKKALASK